jgi:hypothetical protein
LRSAAGCQEKFEGGESKKWSHSYRNNVHLLDRVTQAGDAFIPGPSNHLLYYDAASLYPSSGTATKNKKSFTFHPPALHSNFFSLPPHFYIFFGVGGVFGNVLGRRKKGPAIMYIIFLFAELKDVPHGTGTVFARMQDDDEFLHRQPRNINITEREEGIVAQFLQTPAGHLAFCEELAEEYGHSPKDYTLQRIFSGLHAGQGRQCFGSSSHQLCDFTLFFSGPEGTPVALFYVNYHGMYYHYKGHFPGCQQEDDGPPFSRDPFTEKLDNYRTQLATLISSLDPQRLTVRYRTLSACDLFHSDIDLEEYLQGEMPADCCLPRKSSLWNKKWRTEELVEAVLDGRVTGFLTLRLGFEDNEKGCLLERNFGFCVQKRKPAEGELSDFTLAQIARREKLEGEEEMKKYLRGMAPRTFSARSFGTEETVSTTYFCWLVRERGLQSYSISHFILYKFCDYSSDFLQPILERRHRYKLEKNVVGAECLKLVANGSFGYTALESRNYNDTHLKTDLSVKKNRYNLSSKFSMMNASFVGVVRCRSDQKPTRFKRTKRKKRRCSFLADEADDDDEKDKEIDEAEDELGFDQECMIASDESDVEEDNCPVAEDGGDVNDVLCGETGSVQRNFKFLYTVTVTGKYKRIQNCIPRAVAILSNSKKLFLNLVLSLLRASDPGKVEPVYCDTDSIILSCQFPSLEQNLREGGEEYLRSMEVVGLEQSETSIHGKLKLEGVFAAGFFRALKVYRLFDEGEMDKEGAQLLEREEMEELCPSLSSLKTVYTRCKGVSRSLATQIDTSTFAPSLLSEESLKIHKSSLRPTRAGEMTIQLERRTLAQPYNFKRSVCPDGIHSLPFD